MQWRSFKKKMEAKRTIVHKMRKRVEISGMHNEEWGLEEFYNHRTYRRQERQWETLSNLPNEFMQMNGRTGSGMVQTLLRAIKVWKLWIVIFTHVLNGHSKKNKQKK